MAIVVQDVSVATRLNRMGIMCTSVGKAWHERRHWLWLLLCGALMVLQGAWLLLIRNLYYDDMYFVDHELLPATSYKTLVPPAAINEIEHVNDYVLMLAGFDTAACASVYVAAAFDLSASDPLLVLLLLRSISVALAWPGCPGWLYWDHSLSLRRSGGLGREK